MAVNNVHLPVGYEIAIWTEDDVAWVDLGFTYNEATLSFEYTAVKITGSQAEKVLNYVKDMLLNGTFTLVQQDLKMVSKLMGGVTAYTATAGTPVAGEVQTDASGAWEYKKFIPFENQNGAGTIVTVNSVTGGTDGLLVVDVDYWIQQDAGGLWGIMLDDSNVATNLSTIVQDIVTDYDYTPSASRNLTAGSASVDITSYQIRIRKQLSTGKYYTIIIHAAVNTGGLSITMPRYDADEPNILEIAIEGQIDTSRSNLDQLFSITDEYAITDNTE